MPADHVRFGRISDKPSTTLDVETAFLLVIKPTVITPPHRLD